MSDGKSHGIPGPSIGDTDLDAVARTNPEAAREIARLAELMRWGKDTEEEFLRLCQLLVDVGSTSEAEHLLRRNISDGDGLDLYLKLFGTEKLEEFEDAIKAFKSQFGLALTPVMQHIDQFLTAEFHSNGGPARSDDFAILAEPIKIEFGYIQKEIIEVDISLLDGRSPGVRHTDECLFMLFEHGVWEIADPLES